MGSIVLHLAQREGIEGLLQLIVLALFFAGPVLAKLLKGFLERQQAQGGERPPAPRERTPSDAEHEGRDLWRQLMELDGDDEVAELEEVEPRPPRRRPAAPLGDPDVERVQGEATERRAARRAARAEADATPAPRPKPVPPPMPQPVLRPRASDGPGPSAPLEAFETGLDRVPTEESLERASRRELAQPSPVSSRGAIGSRALPSGLGASMGSSAIASGSLGGAGGIGVSSAPSRVARRAAGSRLVSSRADLRRGVLWSEVLGTPVSLRDEGCGGRGAART